MKLEVQVIGEEIIKPSSPTPQQLRHYQLSSLDQQIHPVYNHLVLFYPIKPNLHTNNLNTLHHFKLSLSQALTHFYPLAGRIRNNTFVDCNDDGVPFKEAQVKCRLSDVLQNPVPEELNKLFPFPLDDAKELPTGVQFNAFDCGGVGIGLCISHKIGDALSYFTFLNTWAAIARGDTNDVVLPEFVSAELFPPRDVPLPEPALETSEKNIATKRLVFTASKIEEIRAKYSTENEIQPSRVEALSAFIWSRFITSTKKKSSPHKSYVIIHTVNLRTKFQPPLSAQSFGNIFSVAATIPSLDNEEEEDGCNLVRKIRESIRKIDKEYVKKLQAGGDLFQSTNQETIPFIVTSLCRFPLHKLILVGGNQYGRVLPD
ncbi:putative 3'-N-debenzoyl-2'-deoxytaxol N-benzoyltransferase [Hibiscus syriacus]|uniref:3'-N-debenzoyl-2'-deoxytaxol N-benzoyltransferase n=1 Tax=Hibiscus syriacus TaxID=106335 RepID=A0A6A2ZV64_HIBSY|nr:putative 3'-N-debenzoyl-2'-deoxytaxol N-benzoyltransferase [Hibiscus syriacus]